ncbi:MAG: tRNA dihydrouridine synthase DusB [Deltaproteobacteria bacterium]|nr:tRNA dihydrouridine synthase DusB [Candidatus Anaeroferrophillus wilburensis]MBN2889334.1 tRNA dihydrouridine synthase DusB [Deltaproteobacteria bacterium]
MFSNQPLILAPMAGITDSPFRQLTKQFGADLVVTEMISAKGLLQGDRKTATLLNFCPQEQPLIAQLFGRDPEILRAAAQQAIDQGATYVDINMGCPVKKVIKTGAGAALLQDLQQVKKILAALSRPPAIPYTIKIRSGWDQQTLIADKVIDLAATFAALAVFCHPRTAAMMFSGMADWDYLEAIAGKAPLPVIGSGDIITVEAARKALARQGINGLMLGRGTLGRPWFFQEIRDFLISGSVTTIPWAKKLETIRQHGLLLRQEKGEKTGFLLFRKHLAWYSRGLPGAAAFRRQLFTTTDQKELDPLLQIFFSDHHYQR